MKENLSAMQMCIFDIDRHEIETKTEKKVFSFENKDKDRLDHYTLEAYCEDVNSYGLADVWHKINYYTLNFDAVDPFLDIDHFGELYEIGLALIDKQQKKESGQYYTPEDVASVMSTWFKELEAENICDVACGTGKLILTYLDIIGAEKAVETIQNGKLYLYDTDGVALSICKTILLKKYGKELDSQIHTVHGDFLSKKIALPENCKVICNPPYASVNKLSPDWEKTNVSVDTKELYAMFMEKILQQSKAAVIITPYSFIGGKKYYSLRLLMNEYHGSIVSFDNVPGNIFCGRKHGIFNTNTSNSVRAAITVIKNDSADKGFGVSPLIRFKTEERKALLNSRILEQFVSDRKQTVDKKNTAFVKIHKELEGVYDAWISKSNKKVKDILSPAETDHVIYVPNTCRYFTTAAHKKLNRTGMITLFVKDKGSLEFLYCFINSSFAYWWWRIFDGGITYPKGLLKEIPVLCDMLTPEDRAFFADMFREMVGMEADHTVTKLNAGEKQENIKFPPAYREKINQRILNILKCKEPYTLFDLVHANNVFDSQLHDKGEEDG